MPRLSRYHIIHSGSFTLVHPDADNGLPAERHLRFGDLPNVVSTERAILLFRINPSSSTQPVVLRMRINNQHLMGDDGVTFTSDPTRSWHEIVPRNTLHATGNELTASVGREGAESASIQVAEIVLMYTVDLPD